VAVFGEQVASTSVFLMEPFNTLLQIPQLPFGLVRQVLKLFGISPEPLVSFSAPYDCGRATRGLSARLGSAAQTTLALERSDGSKIAGCVSGFGELIPQKNMGLSLKASGHWKHSRSKVQQALWHPRLDWPSVRGILVERKAQRPPTGAKARPPGESYRTAVIGDRWGTLPR
jgi:hypothetical protein